MSLTNLPMRMVSFLTGESKNNFKPQPLCNDYKEERRARMVGWDTFMACDVALNQKLSKPRTTKAGSPADWARYRLLTRGWVETSEINKEVKYGGGGFNLNEPRSAIMSAIKALEAKGHIISRPEQTKNGVRWKRYTLVS